MLRLAATSCRRVETVAPPHCELVFDMRRDEAPKQKPPLTRFDGRAHQGLQVPRELGLADPALANRQPQEHERADPERVHSRRRCARRIQYRHRHVFAP
jgi:hypothetical protein